jgi:hypothetical protein
MQREKENMLATATPIGSYQFSLSGGSCTNVLFEDEIPGCINIGI